MSGIGAIYYLDGREVETSSLEAINDILEHRGRDAVGVWKGGPVGLTHRMMWTTPESLIDELPAVSTSRQTSITCDTRLDNRDELIEGLGLRGRSRSDVTDSEIILAAYEKWGTDCPARLIGDFVFVIWDAQERTLFAARDPLGVKHFYFHYQPGKVFALASEIKALLAIEEIPCELDEQHLGDYLAANSEDKESTFYKGILRLPATHALLVKHGDLRTWRYWMPATEELRLKNDAEYEEAFKERFVNAVTSRLRSAYPTGSMLSGGLDSSSIVCVADDFLQRNGRDPLHTFSAIFPQVAKIDPRIDESRFMLSVVNSTKCEPHFVEVDGSSPLKDSDEILRYADDPVGAPIYMDWAIYKEAKASGVRVMLSGIDGDSTVSHGYEDLANFALRRRYLRLLRESIALSRNMPRASHRFKRSFWNRGLSKAVPAWVYAAWRKARGRKPEDYTPSPIMFPRHFESIREEFRRECGIEDRLVELRRRNYPDGISPIEFHWRALTNGHFAMVLENSEKAAASKNIEPRYPFFDRRLIEFCISLPPGQRIRSGWTRSIFRHAMRGIVPSDVLWRTDKSNIGASVKINLMKYGRPALENALFEDSGRLEKYLDLDFVRKGFRRYAENPLESDAVVLQMLTTVYLSKWLKIAGFDANGRGPGVKKMTTAAA